MITLSRSLIEPFLTFSTRRDLRELAWRAWAARGENAGATDNRQPITELVKLRIELANLMGYPTLCRLLRSTTAWPKRRRGCVSCWIGYGRLPCNAPVMSWQSCKPWPPRTTAGITIEPWDWRYYAEKVRAAEFDLDEAEIKPYLPLDRMIEAAFSHRHAVVRHYTLRNVRGCAGVSPGRAHVFEVSDAQGQPIGLFYADYFARPSKRSGAWMSAFRRQHQLDGGGKPIIVNVLNFAKGPGKRADAVVV